MASNEEGEESVTKGNEWEVVSLTASAYAAAPGPKEGDSGNDIQGNVDKENEAETSNTMFMSGHFVFPPSEHEKLPMELAYSEIQDEKGGEYEVPLLISNEGKSDLKGQENVSVEGLIPDEFPGIPVFDEKGNSLSVSGMDVLKDIAFDEEQSIYSSADFSSIYSELKLVDSNANEEGERTDDTVENIDDAMNSSLQKPTEGDNYDDNELPCKAWWKRQVISLYTHAKEANAFWSICIAAAVMGLVIIGHRWQQERLQNLHLRWQSSIRDERLGMVLGQMSRLKDVIVGGHRRGSLVRGSPSA